MRHELPLLPRHLVLHGLAAGLGVLLQVVLAASSNAQELLGAEWIPEDDVRAGPRVVRQLRSLVHLPVHQGLIEAHRLQEVPHLLDPFFLDLPEVRLGIDEVLDLHLLELP